MDPQMWKFIIQLVMGMAQASQQQKGDPYDVDLGAVRDRFGMKDLIRGDIKPSPEPMPVKIVGGPAMPYASGS